MNIVLRNRDGREKQIGTVKSLENIQDILEEYKEWELFVFADTAKEIEEGDGFYTRIRKELDILAIRNKYL